MGSGSHSEESHRKADGERLFIAIDIPEEVRRTFKKTAESIELNNARYSRLDQMHLTLRFLGNVPGDRKEKLIQMLHDIHLPSFELDTDSLGVFPKRGMSRILWVGLKESDVLNELQRSIEDVVEKCGFEAYNKPWHPHITLARLKGRNHLTQEILEESSAQNETMRFPVDAFYLYRSEFKKSGAVYSIQETFKLVNGSKDA